MPGPVALIALLILAWGALGLLAPSVFKTKTRWVALGLIATAFQILAIAQFIWPEKGAEDEAASALLIVSLFFGGLTALVIFGRIGWRANAIKHGADLPDHWLDFAARSWGNWAKGMTAKLAEQSEQAKAAPPPPPPAPKAQAPQATPSPPPPHKPNPPRPKPAPSPQQPSIEDAQESRPAKSSGIVADTVNAPTVNRGRSVWITYVDSDGEVTEREVANWVMTRIHLEGHCLLRKRKRLFRRDRIIAWGEWY